MIANGPFNKFRKEHDVFFITDSVIEKGVIKPGQKMPGKAMFSVQSIKNTQEIEGLSEGRRLSDWRRLYSDKMIPLVGDDVSVMAGELVANDKFIEVGAGLFLTVGAHLGEAGGMSNPATVIIDGYEYEFIHREPWQNGIISHYKYYVVRKQYNV